MKNLKITLDSLEMQGLIALLNAGRLATYDETDETLVAAVLERFRVAIDSQMRELNLLVQF